ncbi:MAG: ATP-dependent helicase [bacterium]|nr:ATP-dependent helicase [bacterium]MDE0600397.1 ATP-dependent helicase [bacterium]
MQQNDYRRFWDNPRDSLTISQVAWTPTGEQQAIISHDIAQHGRVLAGPGTGKSATVIRMMLRIAQGEGGRGKLLTFTRSATNELKEKVAKHPEALLAPSTIHSFSIASLLANPGTSGLPEPIRIADEWEQKTLIRNHLKSLVGCDVRTVDRAFREMASNWESLCAAEDPDLPEEVRNRFTGIWERHRAVFGYSLLSELTYRFLLALEDHPDLELGYWQVLVVDEYQDLNQCDLSVLNQIASRGHALVAVGDDDQSIYSFRRAHPVGIRRFLSDYPGARDYTLSISHRCARSILGWARHVIEGLPERTQRPVLLPAPQSGQGEAKYLGFENWKQETQGVARLVRWLIGTQKVAPEDIAVLFRTNYNNAWSADLVTELEQLNIPVVNPGEVEEMLAEESNRRLLALARLIVNQRDSLAWWTILHHTRGVGPRVRDYFYESAVGVPSTFADQLLLQFADGFEELMPSQRSLLVRTVRQILELVRDIDLSGIDLGDRGWGTWLSERADEFGGCEARFRQLLWELDDILDRQEGLGRFLGQIQPVGEDLRSGRGAEAVRLMTMTSSKGLTVRASILVGVEEGVVPLGERDPDEERRLLYVAMTRSTEFLYLTWSGRRTGRTARTGVPRVGGRRRRSSLLAHGPVRSEAGMAYLRNIGALEGPST